MIFVCKRVFRTLLQHHLVVNKVGMLIMSQQRMIVQIIYKSEVICSNKGAVHAEFNLRRLMCMLDR